MGDKATEREYPPFLIATLAVLAALCVTNFFVSLYGSNLFKDEDGDRTEAVILPRVAPRVAFVTGGVDPFWDITVAGARDAAVRYGAELQVHIPEEGAPSQDKILRDLLTKQVNGVAISPLNADGQTGLLNQVAAAVNLVTFDSDAPRSKRLCYVGTNNYTAGWLCGEVVHRVLPAGGRVLISIGSLDKDNGRKRRQGLIDELLGRVYEPAREPDPPDVELSGSAITIVATVLDENNADQAKANMIRAIGKHPDVDCLVGLFGYSGPSILAALTETGKLGQIKVVAFDDHEATLNGIRDGYIDATIVQDAYQFGYASVKALATLTRDEGELPLSREILFPCFAVQRDNLERFAAERHAQVSGRAG